MMCNFGGFGGFGFGGIFMLLFWGLIIWAIIALIRGASGHSDCCGIGGHNHGHREDKKNSALNILEERYAKGEINKEEFDQKKKDLT